MTSYRAAGVDIDGAAKLIGEIRKVSETTRVPGVLGGIGLFAGSFLLPAGDYREPVLVSGTDGVGTKILLAEMLGRYDTVGIDLVAMCVNDIITCGARPLFFLDYLAVGEIRPGRDLALVRGIADGCRQAGCALLGGETAQMNDVYGSNGFDLAGFAVGVAEKSAMISGAEIVPGDVVLGLPSSGLHSNGFSLVRKIFPAREIKADPDGLGATLLTPTRIYASVVAGLVRRFRLKGLAHITGGGLTDNLPRVLPPGTRAALDPACWPALPVFQLVGERSGLPRREMFRTFNQGIGMVVVADEPAADQIIDFLAGQHEPAWRIGVVEKSADPPGCVIAGC